MSVRLTEAQRDSIDSSSPHRILVAGPGTGKSATILGFIENAISTEHIPASRIFVLTFTRAATAELQKKVADLAIDGDVPSISTLHGFSLRQVMKNSNAVDFLPTDFVVADDHDERDIIQEDLKRMLRYESIRKVHELFQKLSSNWETLNADRSDWIQAFSDPGFIGAWQEHRKVYGYALRSELVYQFKKLLEQLEEPNIDGPIYYLVVDEYQDLNKCDLRVIEMLVQRDARLFCAGDDDQSIYGFRYAFPEGIRRFTNDYPNSTEFVFGDCFRCGSIILSMALRVIEQDYTRIPKRLRSLTQEEGIVRLLRFVNQDTEAKKIAYLVNQLSHDRGVGFGEIIVLLRSDHNRAFSKVIADALSAQGIPVLTKHSQFGILDSFEGQYFTAIAKIIKNRKHDLAIRTILNLTAGVGPTTIDAIYRIAIEERRRFGEVCRDIAEGEYTEVTNTRRAQGPLNRLFSIDWDQLTDDDFSNQIDSIIALVPDCSTGFRSELDGLINSMHIDTLDNFLGLVTDIVSPREQELAEVEAVRIISMHQAKGLSAQAVFVVAVENEYLPGRGNDDEERRLLYVSMTRARLFLFLTYCSHRTGQQAYTGTGHGTTRTLSRFVADADFPIVPGAMFQLVDF